MKSDPPPPADLPNLLRQQLILAQVRIMELEDERDALADRLAAHAALLRDAQQLADTQLAAAAQAAGRAEALAVELRAASEALAAATRATAEAQERGSTLARERDAVRSARDEAAARATTLAAELHALRATRSWRWTAWLRALAGGDPRP